MSVFLWLAVAVGNIALFTLHSAALAGVGDDGGASDCLTNSDRSSATSHQPALPTKRGHNCGGRVGNVARRRHQLRLRQRVADVRRGVIAVFGLGTRNPDLLVAEGCAGCEDRRTSLRFVCMPCIISLIMSSAEHIKEAHALDPQIGPASSDVCVCLTATRETILPFQRLIGARRSEPPAGRLQRRAHRRRTACRWRRSRRAPRSRQVSSRWIHCPTGLRRPWLAGRLWRSGGGRKR